jgi:HlyD family secretion protein
MEKRQVQRLLLAVGIVVLLVIVLVWIGRQKPVPRVTAVKAVREDITAVVITNGKVEPVAPAVMRAQLDAFVSKVLATEGRIVHAGQPLLKLDVSVADAQLTRLRQTLLEAEDALRAARAGGHADELAQLERDLRTSQLDLDRLRSQRAALERLLAKQAATPEELNQTKLALERAEANEKQLEAKKADLARRSRLEVETAQLQVQRTRDEIAAWEEKVRQGDLAAPIAGTLYLLPVRAGDYVHTGDLLAEVADLSNIRVRAFVDEPELGAVAPEQPVEISWDALPGRKWKGRTEQVPKTVVPRGTRIVGEVLCSVDNDKLELLPNTNVNVRILTRQVKAALVVPRGAVRAEGDQRFVFVIEESTLGVNAETLRKRAVRLGIGSATNFEVLEGLREGEQVALPGDVELADGIEVRAISRD